MKKKKQHQLIVYATAELIRRVSEVTKYNESRGLQLSTSQTLRWLLDYGILAFHKEHTNVEKPG